MWMACRKISPFSTSQNPSTSEARPARSDRGWHVVKLVATRPFERPDLATARAWLHPYVLSQKVQQQLAQWRAEADIRLPDRSAPAGSAR